MKKLLLTFLFVVSLGVSMGWAQGSSRAAFDTFTSNNSAYVSAKTNISGVSDDEQWSVTNSMIVDNKTYITGTGAKKAPYLNGNGSKLGTLISPTITGGIGTLTYYYGSHNDTNIYLKIEILQKGVAVKSKTLTQKSITKSTAYSDTIKCDVAGDFVISVTNASPSTGSSNTNRAAIWDLEWDGYVLDADAAPTTPIIVDGNLEDGKYVIYADGTVTFMSTNAEYITVNGTKITKNENGDFVYTPNFVLDTTEELTVVAYNAKDVASEAAKFTLSYETKYGTAEHPYSVAKALKVITDGKYTSDMVYTHGYVTLDGITTPSTGYRTYYIADKDSETKLMVYSGKGLDNADFADGDLVANAEVVVYGALTMYTKTSTPEINKGNYLVSYTAPAVPTPETPAFDVAAGIVDAGTVVHIICATEGVSIYYTTNGDTPTEESTLYTADGITINEAVTIKAVAINQGVNSAIAAANYVCLKKEEGATSATFDFSKLGLVSNPYIDYPTESASIDGVTFTSNDVTMSVDKNGGSNNPVWFVSTAAATSGQTEARVYTNAILTFKNTAEKGLITSIVFSQTKNSTKWADPTASVDGEIVEATTEDGDFITKTFTPEIAADNIVFTANGTCAFSNVVVNYAIGEIPVLSNVECGDSSIYFEAAADVKVYYQVKDEQVANSELAAEDWVAAAEVDGLAIVADDTYAMYEFTAPLVTAGKYLYVKPENDKFTGEISVLTFDVSDVPTGIEGVEADANAPVEYFNLQGIRIANPSRGIYVKRQGSAVTKVLVK
jgi:hypothetical protein